MGAWMVAFDAFDQIDVDHRGVAKSLKYPKWAKGVKNSLTGPLWSPLASAACFRCPETRESS
jgi:hypothetical protein